MDLLIYMLVALGVILVSMTLHEAMHGFMAYWLGDDTAKREGRLTLNPVKHIDPFLTIVLPMILALLSLPIFGGAKPVPFNPGRLKYDEWGAALVAAAGPLTNFFIAFLGYGVWVVCGMPGEGTTLGLVLQTTIYVNLGFFVFNSIPLPPLDGSRILYALAPDFIRRAMEVIEQYGILLVFVVVMAGGAVLGTFMLAAINAILTLFMHIFAL